MPVQRPQQVHDTHANNYDYEQDYHEDDDDGEPRPHESADELYSLSDGDEAEEREIEGGNKERETPTRDDNADFRHNMSSPPREYYFEGSTYTAEGAHVCQLMGVGAED